MPYTAQQMFDLIADIRAYPEFLPWCSAVRIRNRSQREDGTIVIDADLVVSFKVYREKFASRVVLHPESREIDVSYLDGPFRYLDNHWRFVPAGEGACEVDFYIDFAFKSRTLQTVVGAVFTQAMQQIVRAFERRAEALYARPKPRPSSEVAAQNL